MIVCKFQVDWSSRFKQNFPHQQRFDKHTFKGADYTKCKKSYNCAQSLKLFAG